MRIERAGLSLALWDGRGKGKNLRVYLTGLPGQTHYERVWLEEGQGNIYPPVTRTFADSNFINAAEKWLASQGNPTWGQVCQWVMAPSQPAPIPQPTGPTMDTLRSTLEQSLIVHLVPAARMAGLAFKNGLQKAEIIDRLCRNEDLARRAVDALAKLREGNLPEPSRARPDWLDDDEPTPGPTAPQLVPEQAPAPTIDLSQYVKRPELAPFAREHWAREQILAAEGRVSQRCDALDAAVAELQEKRPLVITLPGKPEPVKVNGLRHEKFEDALRACQAGVHVMLVGPAGSGKTYAAEQIAHALSLTYHKQPPVNYAHEILGHFDAHNRYHRTPTREAVEHGGLLNLDEFDASSADAGLACNQVADSSSFVAFPDGMVAKNRDFVIIAGTNTDGSGATMEYAGRARLDGATLNRFALIQWGYDPRVEDSIGSACPEWVAAVRAVRAFALQRGILDVCATMRDIATGVRLIGAGLSRTRVLEMTQQRGAVKEAWAEVCRLPAVSRFIKG